MEVLVQNLHMNKMLKGLIISFTKNASENVLQKHKENNLPSTGHFENGKMLNGYSFH